MRTFILILVKKDIDVIQVVSENLKSKVSQLPTLQQARKTKAMDHAKFINWDGRLGNV